MAILVTGATGHIGSRVAEILAERGAPLQRLARDPAKAPKLEEASIVRGDYADPVSLVAAMDGIDTVFLVSAAGPPLERARLHGNVIDAAVAARVRRLVYLSFQSASATSPFPYSAAHLLTEAHLKQSGLAFTNLRDSFYLDLLPEITEENGDICGPAGSGKAAWVAREDVAQVAAAVLTEDRHQGQTYDVTGSEAFGLGEAATRLSALTGRQVRYKEETQEAARRRLIATGVSDCEIDASIGTYLAIASGELSQTSDTVERLTGRRPLTLEAYFNAFPERLGALASPRSTRA
ncbi:MAG TPA: SDR family oxidoreductase [Rhizomicrobium sp.]|jgi:uncharacterized protein YbjT (DUF2867 family)